MEVEYGAESFDDNELNEDCHFEAGAEDIEVDAYIPGKSVLIRIILKMTARKHGAMHFNLVREEKARILSENHVPNPQDYVMRIYFVDDGYRSDLFDCDHIIDYSRDLAMGCRGNYISFDLKTK